MLGHERKAASVDKLEHMTDDKPDRESTLVNLPRGYDAARPQFAFRP
jgi:hypothetical protein